MSGRKWLVSFPLAQDALCREEHESERDFARRLMQHKRFSEALVVYDRLLVSDPEDAGLLTNASLAESKIEHMWQSSARHAQKALQIQPNNIKAWYRFGFALAEMGLKERADECCAKALALDDKNAAVLELKKSLESITVAPVATREIYGGLINSDSPCSVLTDVLWTKILSYCPSSDWASLRLTCSLFHHLFWSQLAPTTLSIHSAKPWRLSHRLWRLNDLTVVVRHGQIEADWTNVCQILLNGRALSVVFPALAHLRVTPSVSGLSRKEIKALISKLDKDTFEDEEDLEDYIACPEDGRLDLASSLGRCPPKLVVHLNDLRPPKSLPGNLHGLHVEGNLARCTNDDFKAALVRSNLFELKIKDSRRVGSVTWSNGSGLENKLCETLPATLERLSLKNLPSFCFPCSNFPQGLKRLSVAGLYWKDPHLRGLPPLLETLVLDLRLSAESEDRQFAYENFSLVGIPKRVSRCIVYRPATSNWKMGKFDLDSRSLSKSATLIVK